MPLCGMRNFLKKKCIIILLLFAIIDGPVTPEAFSIDCLRLAAGPGCPFQSDRLVTLKLIVLTNTVVVVVVAVVAVLLEVRVRVGFRPDRPESASGIPQSINEQINYIVFH